MSAGGVMGKLRAPLDERAEDVVAVVLHPSHQSVLQVSGLCDVYLRASLHCVCVCVNGTSHMGE